MPTSITERNSERGSGFLGGLLSSLTLRGRNLFRSNGQPAMTGEELIELSETLLSRRGEATGVALAGSLLAGYAAATEDDKFAFLEGLADKFGPELVLINEAIEAVRASGGSADAVGLLMKAAEPRRQELIRRLNLAPGGTASLVKMREAVLARLTASPALKHVDNDFVHLFTSWFNRGFLVLRRIDWTTPANILEKIIRYEAVHAIRDWDDLRRRLAPPDRRCFAFFHPATGRRAADLRRGGADARACRPRSQPLLDRGRAQPIAPRRRRPRCSIRSPTARRGCAAFRSATS